ncbi:MAG: hypothetical protein AAF581_15505 [Planctomycetota bacterium]
MTRPRIVLKFGSSVLPSPAQLEGAAVEVERWLERGYQVLAVVSAFRGRTDDLYQVARDLAPGATDSDLAQVVAIGELESLAQFTLVLNARATPTRALDTAMLAIKTAGPTLDAEPIDVNTELLDRYFRQVSVVVMPGFLGRDVDNRPTLLGRGGSDLSALFLAHALGCPCRLLKDTGGVHEWDPACRGPRPRRFSELSFEDALQLDDDVLQRKGTRFCAERSFRFVVSGLGYAEGTAVGGPLTRLVPLALPAGGVAGAPPRRPPRR